MTKAFVYSGWTWRTGIQRLDFDNYRYYMGTDLEVRKHLSAGICPEPFMTEWSSREKKLSICFAVHAGPEVSGMRRQLLNMGLAGFREWTTDIGGFTAEIP